MKMLGVQFIYTLAVVQLKVTEEKWCKGEKADFFDSIYLKIQEEVVINWSILNKKE